MSFRKSLLKSTITWLYTEVRNKSVKLVYWYAVLQLRIIEKIKYYVCRSSNLQNLQATMLGIYCNCILRFIKVLIVN